MKNVIKAALLFSLATVLVPSAWGQQSKKAPKAETKQEEIIIKRKSGGSDKTTIVIEGDQVTVNGKPMNEFKSGNVTIRRMNSGIGRSIEMNNQNFDFDVEHGGNNMRMFPPGPPDAPDAPDGPKRALLGVMSVNADEGAKVMNVNKNSAAEKAGIKTDDIITMVGDKKIDNPGDLAKAIESYEPNQTVDISLLRDKKSLTVKATLGETKPSNMGFGFQGRDFNFNLPRSFDGSMFSWNKKPKIGMQVQDLEEGNGVEVKEVDEDSPAKTAGMQKGDIISTIDGNEIDGVDGMRSKLADLKEGVSLKVDYKRDGKAMSATIKIPKKLKTADL